MLAAAALDLAVLSRLDLGELPLEVADAVTDEPPVHFELSFTRAAQADAASLLPRQVGPHLLEPRQRVLELRQFDLEPGLTPDNAETAARQAKANGIQGVFLLPSRASPADAAADEAFLGGCRRAGLPVVLVERGLRGHGGKPDRDLVTLRDWLRRGGFLHIDDNYGMDESIRRELARLFPGEPLVEVPLDHPVYHIVYDFPRGLPKIHEHDGKPAQGFGIFLEGRLVVYYSFDSDLGDGWEDAEVHRDTPEARESALRMGVNLFSYAVSGGR